MLVVTIKFTIATGHLEDQNNKVNKDMKEKDGCVDKKDIIEDISLKSLMLKVLVLLVTHL